MTPQNDRERRKDDDLGDLASSYRKAAPYMAASTQLVMAVALFTLLGWWGDQKLGHQVPWMLMVGAAVGMAGGFISFFKTIANLGKKG